MAAGFFNGLAEALSITILCLGLLEITAISSVQLHFSGSCNSAGNSFETVSLALGKKNNEKKRKFVEHAFLLRSNK